jgi:hypothetical protein
MTPDTKHPQREIDFEKFDKKLTHYVQDFATFSKREREETVEEIHEILASCIHTSTTPASEPEPSSEPRPREEVLLYSQAMERVLRKNDYKGGWNELSLGDILDRIDVELKEAHEAWNAVKKREHYDKVSEELIDVANFCMMFYDNWHLGDPLYRATHSTPAPASEHCIGSCPCTVTKCPEEKRCSWLAKHDRAIREGAYHEGELRVLGIIRTADDCCCPHELCRSGEGHDNLNCRDCLIKWIEESLRLPEPGEAAAQHEQVREQR